MDIQHSAVLLSLGGIAFFLFGMKLASESIQKFAGNQVKTLLVNFAKRPSLGVVAGILLTGIIQSSGAVTSMLVGLGSAGVVNLRQVLSVILGTAIGTTLTVQLISFNIIQFGLPIFTYSFIVFYLTNKKTLKKLMGVFMGFGLIFWGLELIGYGTSVLKDVKHFTDFIQYSKEMPLYTIIFTAIFTTVVHSSAAVIGFAMSLAAAGLIGLEDSVFWIYGANIGTTGTALLASAGGNYVGRQIAWAHFFFKIAGVAVFYKLTHYSTELAITGSMTRDIANLHTFFNIATALLFFFFIPLGVKFIEFLVRPSAADREFSAKYLKRQTMDSNSVCIAHAEREVLRMADYVVTMVRESIKLFENEDEDLLEFIRDQDNKVDYLNKEINLFLARNMDEFGGLQKPMIKIMMFSSDLESVGDVIDNILMELSRKKHALKVEFSGQGWNEIKKMHAEAMEVCSLSVSCFQLKDPETAERILKLKRSARKLEKKLRESHMLRLMEGKQKTINTSSIHLDVLSEYRRIIGLMSNHVYSVLKGDERYEAIARRETLD